MITYYVVQGYQHGKRKSLIADQPRPARDENHCLMLAERMSSSCAAVVAFSRNGDAESGDWEEPVILAKHGEVPQELLDMAG